jgi:hypothetical protein
MLWWWCEVGGGRATRRRTRTSWNINIFGFISDDDDDDESETTWMAIAKRYVQLRDDKDQFGTTKKYCIHINIYLIPTTPDPPALPPST